MSSEYEIRRKKADDVLDRVKDYLKGYMIVGSVAYNPESVTSKSDLDLVGIADFSEIDFEEFEDHALFRSIEYKPAELTKGYDPKHYSQKKANVAIFRWDEEFRIALHLWDVTALEKVVNLERVNTRFHEECEFISMFRNGVDNKTLHSYSGESYNYFTNPRKVDKGLILDLPILIENEGELYPGVQINNLLLDPVILFEENHEFIDAQFDLRRALYGRMLEIYGEGNSKKVNIFNSLPYKTKPKIGPELKRRLDAFF